MAVDNRITRKRVANHLAYDWWKYLIAVGVVTVCFVVVFAVTEYTPPKDKTIEVMLVGTYVQDDCKEALKEQIFRHISSDQELVDFIDCTISVDDGMAVLTTSDDLTSYQKIQVQFIVKTGNLCLIPYGLYKEFAQQGAFLALDDYITDGVLSPTDDEQTEKLRVTTLEYNDDGVQVESDEPARIYGLPAWELDGLEEYLGYDPAEDHMVIAIPYYAENLDNTLSIIQWLLSL